MQKNKIEDYKVKEYDGVMSVYMYYKNSTYILTIAKDKYGIDVLQKNVENNVIRKIGNFNTDLAWLDSIKWVHKFEIGE